MCIETKQLKLGSHVFIERYLSASWFYLLRLFFEKIQTGYSLTKFLAQPASEFLSRFQSYMFIFTIMVVLREWTFATENAVGAYGIQLYLCMPMVAPF